MPIITITRKNIEEAIQTIANATGASQEQVREYIDNLIEYHQLLLSVGDSFALIYGEHADMSMSFEAPFLQIHYTERLHPRKDGYVKPYWLRIRSNPYRRNYH